MCSSQVPGVMGVSLDSARTAAAALVDSVQAGELGLLAHDELSAVWREVRSVQARLEYVALWAVREVDVRGSFVADGALSTGA